METIFNCLNITLVLYSAFFYTKNAIFDTAKYGTSFLKFLMF